MFRRRQPKVFCIGHNKTGTTSMGKVFADMGLRVGSQRRAESLVEDWGKRDFSRLIRYCHSADAFQDVPFSLEYTFQAVDAAFPGSRFLLTTRASADEWFDSLRRYHAKVTGSVGTPTAAELERCRYLKRGWLWRYHQLVFGADEHSVFDRDLYCAQYVRHNESVRRYFAGRPNALLQLNVADADAGPRLAAFLSPGAERQLSIPHLNGNP